MTSWLNPVASNLSGGLCYVLEPFYSFFFILPHVNLFSATHGDSQAWLMWPPTIQTRDLVCSLSLLLSWLYCAMWPIITCRRTMTPTLLFWWHHRSHADSLLFPVTYCTRDAIVLVTSIVLVTLLFSFTISNSCLWPYSLRLDFLYSTVTRYLNNRVFPIHPLSDPFKVFLSYLKYSRVTTSHQ